MAVNYNKIKRHKIKRVLFRMTLWTKKKDRPKRGKDWFEDNGLTDDELRVCVENGWLIKIPAVKDDNKNDMHDAHDMNTDMHDMHDTHDMNTDTYELTAEGREFAWE